MTIDILKEIVSTEEQAEQIEMQAQNKAREMIASAKKEAVLIIEKATEQAEKDAKAIIQAAEDKAARDIDAGKAETQAQCQKIKTASGERMKTAVDFIVGRIVKP